MDRSQLFLEEFLRDSVPSEFIYVPAERGPEVAGNTGATWLLRGSGGMSLGDFRRHVRQSRELKKMEDYARERRLNREMMEMLDAYDPY